MTTRTAILGFVLAALFGFATNFTYNKYNTYTAVKFLESKGCFSVGNSKDPEAQKHLGEGFACGDVIVALVKN